MTTTDLRTAPPPGSRPGPRPAPAAPGRTGARHAGPPRPLTRFWRGPLLAPRWERPALLALLVGTALLYLWDLGATGTANSFYAAAVQAGTQSWKALLFGSLDSSNFITVDKPPASLWVMGLSGRIFGFNAWSMLVPEALMGVGSVALLRLAVRRWAGPGAGLVAGAALALTPVAVLMFRFDNPDAMLVLCMTAAAYAAVRAVDAAAERAGVRWIALTGALLGLGFLTKMLQAWLVLPAFVAVIVLVAAVTWRRRLLLLGAGLVALVVSVGWYVLLVDLWPTSSRPYIGGSTDNSFLDLVLGYNGLGRIVGGEGNGGGSGGGPGGGTGNTGFGGSTGITRMFNESFGGQISWLLPAALIVLVAGLWLTRRAPRTDRTRAALVLWGGWLLVNGLVFSFMSGTVHAYYSVAMAPGLAGTLAVGGMVAWRRREELVPRLALVAALATTTAWSVVLLRRTPEFLPWLRWVVAVGGAVAVLVVLVGLVSRRAWSRRALPVVLLAALLAGASGSVAYAMDTAATAHTGSIVSAGPSTGNGMGMGGPGGGGRGGPGGGAPPSGERPAGGQQGGQGGGGQGGGPGGTTASAALTSLLRDAGTRWSAAAVGSQSAAPLELSSGTAVMAIGGFSGSDATPTLAQFQALVASGDIHYFLGSGDGGGMGGQGGSGSVGSQITAWVTAHYTATTVGGTTVYDLTAPTS